MARVLLVKPAHKYGFEVTPPLGIGYLAAVAGREGHDVRIIDNRLPSQGFEHYRETLDRWKPDAVGISAVLYEAAAARRLAETARSRLPGTMIVLGGPLASPDPEPALFDGLVDVAVSSEGERVFPELLARLENGSDFGVLPGVAYRNAEGKTVKHPLDKPIEDLDSLPYPAWDLIDLESYFRLPRQGFVYKHRRYFPIYTSRGCPYGCIYCHKPFARGFRPRKAEAVVGEIERLVEDYRIREIQVLDDIFNLRKGRAVAILQGIIDRSWGLSLHFSSGVRADLLDEEVIDLMKRAGTFRVAVSIESGSRRMQKVIRKNLNLQRLKENIHLLAERRIMVNVANMIGLPTETREEAEQTVRFASGTEAHSATFFFVNPFPGTELARMVEEQRPQGEPRPVLTNYFDPRVIDLGLSEMTSREIRSIVRGAWFRFYVLRPRRLWRILRDVPHRTQLLYFAFVILVRALTLAPWVAERGRRREGGDLCPDTAAGARGSPPSPS